MQVEDLEDQKRRDMSQCVHCNEPCSAETLFCENCQSPMHDYDQAFPSSHAHSAYLDVADALTAPHPLAPSVQEAPNTNENSSIVELVTVPRLTLPSSSPAELPQTPSPSTNSTYVNIVEQAIQRLKDAAGRIATVEQHGRRSPKALHLSPLRDISADIQRSSTPLLKATVDSTDEHKKLPEATGSRLPDLWPWLPDAEEGENDIWANHTDPLIRRHFPSSAEIARIEAEDEQRAMEEGILPPASAKPRPQATRLRIAFACLSILSIFALTIDAVLISVAFLHPHRSVLVISGPPTLTITSQGQNNNQVKYGQSVTLHLRHFTPLSNVYITRDVEQPMHIGNNDSLLRMGRNGNADVSTGIDAVSWEPGFHTIEAEDVKTHYTANATLQIIDAGPTRPSHLIIKTTDLDLGSGIQGSNTIQPLTISNAGSGAIVWSASSDQSWLQLTPHQGVFSDSQTIEIGVQRGTLPPGAYAGKITFSSNVGEPEYVQVEMKVTPLPPNVGAVLMVTPAVLSFTTQDGGGNPASQVLVVSNPGKQPLSWSLASNSATPTANQNPVLQASGSMPNWLNIDVTSGVVVPGSTSVIHITANNQNLLPGAYINTLVFSATPGTLNTPQSISVSLTVLPHCGLMLSTGGMSFTAVSNKSNSSVQALGVSTSTGCGAINWHATSSANWLTITPTTGQAQASANSVISVGVNASGMSPGTYTGDIAVASAQSTQSVMVQLVVQPPPPPGAPVMAIAPLTINFNAIQGQPNPDGQAILISNTGQSPLHWRQTVSQLATTWLGASPTQGTINPGQTAQVVVNVDASQLDPGTYTGIVNFTATDTSGQTTAGGSPQTVTVQLQLNPPCALQQPSSSALAFTATQGGADPASQSVSITASGSCEWPVSWKANATSAASWLKLSPASGTISASGQSAPLAVATTIAGLSPGTYTTQVSITAADSMSTSAQGSPQVFSVTLTVQQPCQLVLSSNSLSFSVPQGQSSTAQSVSLHESGACARPVSWTASGSRAWLVLSPTSDSDSGSGGTVNVSVNAQTLPPGTYKASISVSASGNGSALVQNSPQTVTVSVTVTGFWVSGTVNACVDTTCASPVPLPNATVSLVGSSGTQVMSVTSGVGGTYTLTNIALGTYTVSVTGADAAGVQYTGTTSVTVTGNMTNINVNVLPGS